jgi:hypothetical protein
VHVDSYRTHPSSGMSPETSLGISQGLRTSSCEIGGFTREPARAFAGDSGQANGSSTTVPGVLAVSSTSSDARSTARWPSASCGRPMGRDIGYAIADSRGTPTAAVKAGIIESDTVAMPLASSTRWTSPTDRQQKGQLGTSTAASTPSSLIRAAIAGAVTSSSSCGRRM